MHVSLIEDNYLHIIFGPFKGKRAALSYITKHFEGPGRFQRHQFDEVFCIIVVALWSNWNQNNSKLIKKIKNKK